MKTFSILGDSYSTYEGWIPHDYISWYAKDGNSAANNVTNAEETWWWMLMKEAHLQLQSNCSYSGSTVCYSGYGGQDASTTSFVHRMKREFPLHCITDNRPDILFFFGGTNDFWAQSPIGTDQFSNWTNASLYYFAPALAYAFNYLHSWSPNTRIYSVVNDDITGDYRNTLTRIAKHYQIPTILLQDIEKENGHPNRNGMIAIKKQILTHLQ